MSRDYRRYHNPLAAGFLLLLLTGCETQFQSIALGAVGATVLGAQAPNNEIEQIYYLGSFDPQDQLPPQVYRVRVHGQASAISGTKFASGWVQSKLIDSLGTSVSFEKGSKNPKISNLSDRDTAAIKTGRRLVQFGPEGFREAPADHRLVILMGSSPENFFKAIDSSLSAISGAEAQQRNSALTQKLFESLVLIEAERDRLGDLKEQIEGDEAR
ncbi:MAG: hypothetical protein HOO19_01165 [Rhodospirillaceae bacterium]|nr:hypothetical protein [Rhodospirillaceae bacterium]MBT3887592.1 hypothetical protein [Rhodospirillaceae bacterium]MBT4117215.1 hypothetical protein [Rhodospirillaceae bacterium]MBT4720601.1 hypothetical protein [Rhodospirillaceae bacterium]MBT4747910.1 hypothetical protein [Rhodospirillaceae bacterium]